ncbi:unnamed protein product, partial [Meganyctiphanes norvegica]
MNPPKPASKGEDVVDLRMNLRYRVSSEPKYSKPDLSISPVEGRGGVRNGKSSGGGEGRVLSRGVSPGSHNSTGFHRSRYSTRPGIGSKNVTNSPKAQNENYSLTGAVSKKVPRSVSSNGIPSEKTNGHFRSKSKDYSKLKTFPSPTNKIKVSPLRVSKRQNLSETDNCCVTRKKSPRSKLPSTQHITSSEETDKMLKDVGSLNTMDASLLSAVYAMDAIAQQPLSTSLPDSITLAHTDLHQQLVENYSVLPNYGGMVHGSCGNEEDDLNDTTVSACHELESSSEVCMGLNNHEDEEEEEEEDEEFEDDDENQLHAMHHNGAVSAEHLGAHQTNHAIDLDIHHILGQPTANDAQELEQEEA